MAASGILLHPNKAIYVPIPKVACSSFKVICKEIALKNNETELPYPMAHPSDFTGRYSHYFKFCFVRNPWDRIVSLYSNKVLDTPITKGTFINGLEKCLAKYPVFYAGMSFDQFVRSICAIPDKKADVHFRSQYTFIAGRKNHIPMDFIGKFEQLEEDFLTVCDAIGLDGYDLPRRNVSKHLHYSQYYTRETQELVRERFSTDIGLFDYEFAPELVSA